MHRPVRNQRSKGVKIKHVLRICVLAVLCCWLIFQIKRCHYKQKDLETIDTEILSSTHSVDDEVIKLGRKDLQPKETETREEEDDEEHEIEEEKDDEIDENEQYKFDDEDDTVNETEEKDGQSQTAREEHYKADDASSAVTHDHEDQTLDNNKFLEMGVLEHENQTHNRAKVQETSSESADISSDHGQNKSDSTRVVKESETSLKSTNMSTVVAVTAKQNDSGSSKTEGETEDPDEVEHDAIDSTDVRRLEDDAFDNGEDTVAE